MTTEEALEELGIEFPWNSKVSCPKHSDSDPSLHLYPGDRGWFCFGCNTGGDGWALLAHYYDRPVAELMRERGVRLGPRPRSRWEQLDELERRARDLRIDFHRQLKEVWAGRRRQLYHHLRAVEDAVDGSYGDYITARYFPEDMSPFQMELIVRDLEQFYRDRLEDQRRLAEMAEGQ